MVRRSITHSEADCDWGDVQTAGSIDTYNEIALQSIARNNSFHMYWRKYYKIGFDEMARALELDAS